MIEIIGSAATENRNSGEMVSNFWRQFHFCHGSLLLLEVDGNCGTAFDSLLAVALSFQRLEKAQRGMPKARKAPSVDYDEFTE
ncbi:MAG: hypothetical protein P4L87_11875, partial [Formivibrio sp.]|nr:hypothetical protein [Formivibrio sp.]